MKKGSHQFVDLAVTEKDGVKYVPIRDVMEWFDMSARNMKDENARGMLCRMYRRLEMIENAEGQVVCRPGEKPRFTPGRYGLGRRKEGHWWFYVGASDGEMGMTPDPAGMKRYVNYRDAAAVAKHLAGDWQVLDLLECMGEEERLLHSIFCQDDSNDGAENAVKVIMCYPPAREDEE